MTPTTQDHTVKEARSLSVDVGVELDPGHGFLYLAVSVEASGLHV